MSLSLISPSVFTSVSSVPTKKPRALYTEPSLGGTVGILPLEGEALTDTFSMELFFNAVVSRGEELMRHLHTPSETSK